MEIEFNPSGPSKSPGLQASSPVRPPVGQPATDNAPALQGMAELQRKLNDLALTRPNKMAAAQQALSDVKYPPDELLNGIAHLLAIRISQ